MSNSKGVPHLFLQCCNSWTSTFIWNIFKSLRSWRKFPSCFLGYTATILETASNEGGSYWQVTHPGLIDGKGLAGLQTDFASLSRCAVAVKSSSSRAWLAMKLGAPKKIFGVQLARRTLTDHHGLSQGKNVKVQVGNSMQYNANDPVCKEIGQLAGTGLVDYWCDNVHEGQYVILSNDQQLLTICEAKIVISENPHTGIVIWIYFTYTSACLFA